MADRVPRWARHALAIGWLEFRRTLRVIRADRARAVLLGFGVVGTGLVTFGLAALFAVGVVPVAAPATVPDEAAGSVALFWAFGVFIVGQRRLTQHDRVDAEPLLLTTVSPRTLAVGLLVAEGLRAASYLVLPTAGATLVVAGGFDAPVAALLVPLAAAAMLASVVVTGGAVGFLGALLVARYPTVSRLRTPLGLVVVAVSLGPYFAFQTGLVEGLSPAALAGVPVAWFAHLALLGTPVEASGVLAVGSLLLTAALVGPGTLAATRLAEAYWYTDPVDHDGGEGTGADASPDADALASALGRLPLPVWLDRPGLAVARKALVRTRRNPNRLSFVILPAFVGAIQLVSFVQTTGMLAVLPPAAAFAGAWLAGAAFGLNPLGDEGNVLPATLTAGVDPEAFVRGVVYPGALLGAALAILGPVGGGVVAGTAPLRVVALVVFALALTAFALPLAPAIGLRFPRFSAVTAGRSREVVPPALTTVALYTVPLGVVAAVGLVSLLLPGVAVDAVAFLTGLSPSTAVVAAGGYLVAVVVALGSAWLAYRDAVSTFADYRLD